MSALRAAAGLAGSNGTGAFQSADHEALDLIQLELDRLLAKRIDGLRLAGGVLAGAAPEAVQ